MNIYRVKYPLLIGVLFAFFVVWLFTENGRNSFDYKSAKEVVSIRETRRYRNVIVHLDLKGAPPKVEFLERFFELLPKYSVDGILIEYEDMFPYWDGIEQTVRRDHYSKNEIMRINQAANRNNLEVIPLIQTFGHLEFVLEKPEFQSLSESPYEFNTICISEGRAIDLVSKMIKQIRIMHPNSTRIHIGADEAYHIAEDKRCLKRMEKDGITKSKMKLEHIAKIGKIAKDVGFSTVFAWNDMFDKEDESLIKEAEIDKFIVPVVWGYASDVTKEGYFPEGLFDRIFNVFDSFYLASAFKGANGINQTFSNISRYLENHRSYDELMNLNRKAASEMSGIFVTGWSRYSHSTAICEILPVAIPSLIADLIYINQQMNKDSEVWDRLRTSLKCRSNNVFSSIMAEWTLADCEFPGNQVFKLIMQDWKSVISRKQVGVTKNNYDNKNGRIEALDVLKKIRLALEPVLFERDIDEIYDQYLENFDSIQKPPDDVNNAKS